MCTLSSKWKREFATYIIELPRNTRAIDFLHHVAFAFQIEEQKLANTTMSCVWAIFTYMFYNTLLKAWFLCHTYFWGLPFHTTHVNWFNFFRSIWAWRHIFGSQRVGTVVCCWLWRGRSSSSNVYTLGAERKETGNEQGWAFFSVEL